MLSRRSILLFSMGIAAALYSAFLFFAPRIILLESDRLASRAATRFRIEFLEAPREIQDISRVREGTGLAVAEVVFGDDPGALSIEDSLAAPPVETPQLTERVAAETIERAYELTVEEERKQKMDARILEISQDIARRDIDVARRLVRPSPEYALPMDALPALRSRDIEPEHIALEPARVGVGLLAQAMPMTDEAPDDMPEERPPFEAAAVVQLTGEPPPVVERLERETVRAPVMRETQRTRQESAYEFLDDMVDIRLDTYLPSNQTSGYFRLRIIPRQDAVLAPLPRDVVFVVDASRSMQQRKLNLVGRGISDALTKFGPEDRFNILLFRDTVTMFRPEAAHATPETIAAAQQFLGTLESRGQTDVYNALMPVAQLTPRANLPGVIFVITDGNPTTGLRDSRAIINAVAADNALRNSVFAYGAGSSVNRYLLDLLAYRNKGEAFVSARIQDAREELRRFIDQLGHPLLVNLKTDYGRIDSDTLFPQVLPDFFRDRPIHVYGRFDPTRDTAFVARITGQAGEKAKEMVFRADLNEAEQGGAEIAQAWAFQKAYHLIGEISRLGEHPDLLAELRQLSRQYNIRTIYDE